MLNWRRLLRVSNRSFLAFIFFLFSVYVLSLLHLRISWNSKHLLLHGPGPRHYAERQRGGRSAT
ncbi:hypothetical protein SKAU_G00380360 [Synaphobranchus kaupii]|uniref:Uncharacterized protein n=1 Tax=Synaphobranchus kaupii TaxID=118154 RepID=A0A9Q1EDI5_SYNKA|nr:hypothetical protein SKAU_G00380360 [Synaphobranchus kaupii]